MRENLNKLRYIKFFVLFEGEKCFNIIDMFTADDHLIIIVFFNFDSPSNFEKYVEQIVF